MTTRPSIGIVLGAGAARGWSHIGALRALKAMDLPIDVICGCSSGALVGSCFATGHLHVLEELASSLTRAGMLRFLDVSFGGSGMIEGRWIADFVRKHIGDVRIEDLGLPLGTVATEYGRGREIWFTAGPVVDAVRASISLPGLMAPVRLQDMWLLDGALVNPLPVTLCRSLGADVIIAINVGGDQMSGGRSVLEPPAPEVAGSSWLEWVTKSLAGGTAAPAMPAAPGYLDVIGDALFNTQQFITRIRLAADPADLVITPEMDDIGIMDFHRGADAIARGEAAVRAAEHRIREIAGLGPTGDGQPTGGSAQGSALHHHRDDQGT